MEIDKEYSFEIAGVMQIAKLVKVGKMCDLIDKNGDKYKVQKNSLTKV